MNSSKIYNRLAGGQKKPISNIIGHLLMGTLIYLFIAWVVIMLTFPIESYKRLSFSVALISVPIYAWYAIKQVKQAAMRIQKRHEMIEAMSEMEFYELDRQMSESEFYYKTFYLLDEYLYAPKARVLIKYTDIESYKTKITYEYFDTFVRWREHSAYLCIYDDEGVSYKIKVKKWRDYLRNEQEFNRMLNEKRAAREEYVR